MPNSRGHTIVFMLLLVNGVASIVHKSQISRLKHPASKETWWVRKVGSAALESDGNENSQV